MFHVQHRTFSSSLELGISKKNAWLYVVPSLALNALLLKKYKFTTTLHFSQNVQNLNSSSFAVSLNSKMCSYKKGVTSSKSRDNHSVVTASLPPVPSYFNPSFNLCQANDFYYNLPHFRSLLDV